MKYLALASLALLTAACASAPDPELSAGSTPTAVATRLQEEKISANRYRVSYLGPPAMEIEAVKDHALMGAAKLTLDNGNDWFEVADQASGQHEHSIEIVMGRGDALAGGTAKTYDAEATYKELRGKLG